MSSFKFIDNLFTPELVTQYSRTPFEQKAELIRTHLLDRLKEDPNYEVFLPLYYFRSLLNIKDHNTPLLIHLDKWCISNKGTILSLRQSIKGRILKPYQTYMDHHQIVYTTQNGKRLTLLLSRAIGCVFVPCQEAHHKDMEIRHRDKNHNNHDFRNLYWETPSYQMN